MDFADWVVKLARAKQLTEQAEQLAKTSKTELREALETLRKRTQRIIEEGDAAEHGYEVAFLDEALRDVHEADRRHELHHVTMTSCQRHEDTVQSVVDELKAEQ